MDPDEVLGIFESRAVVDFFGSLDPEKDNIEPSSEGPLRAMVPFKPKEVLTPEGKVE